MSIPHPFQSKEGFYQLRLERAACLKLAVFEGLSALIFFFLPNPAAFSYLSNNGFGFSPTTLAVINCIGALVYLWLRDDPYGRNLSMLARLIIFFAASIPLLMYLIPLGIILIMTTGSAVGLSYLMIYGVILLVITAVFHGYSRRLEVVTLFGMAFFMGFSTYIFAVKENSIPPNVPFPRMILVALSLIGSAIYVVMLSSKVRRTSLLRRRLFFLIGESVIPVYATVILVSSVFFHSSIFPPVAFYVLYLLISLLPYAIFRAE